MLMASVLAAAKAVALTEQELQGSGAGSCVAIDGNYAAVGASGGAANHGCVYVFKRAGDGSWSQTAILTASDGGVSYAFGNSVGISGEWIIVGSRDWGFSNPVSSGHVYFFKRNANETWTQKASLAQTLVDGAPGQYISAHGASVAIEGDYAVAGDPGFGVDNRGAITVYQRSGDVWGVFQAVSHQPGVLGAGRPYVRSLGYSVDISVIGTTPYIVTGAPESSSDGVHGDGRAFLFLKVGASLNVMELNCQDATRPYYFGKAVSLDWNDRSQLSVAVGACLNDGYQGAVYLFDFVTQVAKLTRPALADGTGYYGVSVALRNDVLAVGAAWVGWEEEYGHNAPVWLYYRNQGGPSQWGLFGQVRSQYYVAQMMDFGNTWASGMDKGVALSGNSLIVNAPGRTYLVGGVNTTGAAFIFGADPGIGVRAGTAAVRISEIADKSTSNGTKTAYIELYNPATNFVSLADTQLAVGKNGSWNVGSYRFSPFATIPSNGFLVVSAGALKDEFEQSWGVDLDAATYNYEIGATNLHLNESCSYRLEQVTRGTVPNPDTTNVLETSVEFPGGCRAVHSSTAQDDWHFDNSYMCTPGSLDWDQFVYSAQALPFREDWSSYGVTSNNWTIYTSTAGKTNWTANNYPNAYVKYDISPNRSTGFKDSLASPLLSGRAKDTIRLGFDLSLVMYPWSPPFVNKGYTTDVLVVSADWITTNIVATYTDIAGDTTWNNQSIDITSSARDQYFRVLFRTTGKNFNYLKAWYLDNISVTATEPALTQPTITRLMLNPRMYNSLQMFWTAGSNGRLHRVYYGTNLLEGIRHPLGIFSESSFLMQPPPDVKGAPSVFFQVRSLP